MSIKKTPSLRAHAKQSSPIKISIAMQSMGMRLFSLLNLLLLCFTTLSNAATLNSRSSTLTPVVGQRFELTISSPQPFSHKPNTQSLQNNFQVHGISQSAQIRSINGQTKSEYQWIISLSAKKAGKLTIPVLTVGPDQSQSITLTALKSAAKINDQDLIILTTSTKPKAPYRQQQITYTVTLKLAQSIASRLTQANLSLPTADNAIIKPLGHDKSYQVQEKNTTYTIVERHFAIFPQHSGKLKIKAPVFTGQLSENQSSTAFVFGFGNHKSISETTADSQIMIQAPPKNTTDWLPAKKVSLQARWQSDKPSFQVGVPLTRIISLEATGLTSTQLPEFSFKVDDARVYVDSAELNDQEQGLNIIGSRTQKITIIPQQAGKLTLPAYQIRWFNTQTGQFATATLPAQTLQVASAATNQNTDISPSNSKAETKLENPSTSQNLTPWLWISLGLLALWLLTLGYYRQRLKLKSKPLTAPEPKAKTQKTLSNSLRQTKKALQQACQANDAQTACQQLLHFIKLKYQLAELNAPKLNLLALQAYFSPAAFAKIQTLHQACYANPDDDNHWCGRTLWRALKSELKPAKSKTTKARDQKLAPFYPE